MSKRANMWPEVRDSVPCAQVGKIVKGWSEDVNVVVAIGEISYGVN
jgi:hypothetical protein